MGPCLFLSLVVFLALAGVAAGSMAATSPVPRATVPPSTYSGGLINTPNPIDRSSSLPITGNVQGGKHFRGTIPYNSTTSFSAPLGSTSLDSFLRYSGVPDGLSGYPQGYGYSPFYSPTGTVTTTLPGYRGVFAPTSPRIAGGLPQTRIDQPSDTLSLTEIPQLPSGQYGTQVDPSIGVSPRLQLWSMSRSPAEMKGVIADELGDSLSQQSLAQPGVPTVAPEEYQRQLEQLRRDIDRIKSDASHLVETRDLTSLQDTDSRMTPQTLPPSPRAPTPPQEPGPTQVQDLASVPEAISIAPSTQPGLRLYDPSADSTGVSTFPPAEVGRTGTTPAPGARSDTQADQDLVDKLSASRRIEETMRGVDTKSRFLGHPPGGVPGGAEAQDSASKADRLRAAGGSGGAAQDAAEVDSSQSAGSRGAPGGSEFRSSASVTQSQFDHYMAAGELYMQQGRYYRAVDSFTLALVYIPHDARANLRKSQALLAAGEYISSAAFLARAIELDARAGTQSIASLHKGNLVEAVGGADAFVSRITDLEEKARSNDAPQLQFLLAYIYYQMDRRPEAQTALEAARQGLPASTALDLLAAAIGDKN